MGNMGHHVRYGVHISRVFFSCLSRDNDQFRETIWDIRKYMKKLVTISVIGLGSHDVRFHTLDWKNTHFFQGKCANFTSIISRMVNK